MTTQIEYEKTSCGRCGGSGRYSFNLVHGSRCYGCGGSGKVLTKRGAAAKAFADTLLDVRVENVGERQARYTDAMTGKRITFTGTREKDNGAFELLVNGSPASVALGRGIRVRLIPTAAEVEAVMQHQASLTKAGTPRKR